MKSPFIFGVFLQVYVTEGAPMKFHFYFKVKREVHSHHLTFPVKNHSKQNDRLVRTGRLLVGAQLDECSVSFHREKINNRFLNGSFAITCTGFVMETWVCTLVTTAIELLMLRDYMSCH